MSKETAVNKLKYPEDKDNPDGPTQIKELAEGLDVLKWGSRNLKPTVGLKKLSVEIKPVESTFQDAGANLEITPAVASNLLLVTFSEFECTEGAGNGESSYKLDSASESEQRAIFNATASVQGATIAMPYLIALTAEAHTIKFRVRKSGSGKFRLGANSGFLYCLVAS